MERKERIQLHKVQAKRANQAYIKARPASRGILGVSDKTIWQWVNKRNFSTNQPGSITVCAFIRCAGMDARAIEASTMNHQTVIPDHQQGKTTSCRKLTEQVTVTARVRL